MTVPLSDAVARSVPAALMARNEMGDLCAWMTFATVSERVENRSTSPVTAAMVVGAVGAAPVEDALGCCGDAADAWERAGEGTGDGYAR